jgi:hypothetical protein
MSIQIIILCVIIIILLYILYYFFIKSSTITIGTQLNLNNSNPPILRTSLTNFTSLNSSYGVWVYVNSWNNTIDKPLFNFVNTLNNNNLCLRLEKFTPTLYCDILDKQNITNKIHVTNVFPIQKWVSIIISIDGSIVDIYINGKLVISKQINNVINFDNNNQITFGNGLDIMLSNFKKFNTPMDPSIAISYYNSGNGNSLSLSSLFSVATYELQLSVLKDNVQQAQITV